MQGTMLDAKCTKYKDWANDSQVLRTISERWANTGEIWRVIDKYKLKTEYGRPTVGQRTAVRITTQGTICVSSIHDTINYW